MGFNALTKVLLAGLGCGLLTAACSAPDPGAYELSDRTPHVGASRGATSGGASSGTSGTSGTSGGSSGTSGSSGGSSGVDAGKDSGSSGVVPDAFKTAGNYVATPGQQATSASHGTANNLPPKKDCLSCHTPGGAAAGKEFTIGGYVKNAAGAAANQVEVRVVDGANAEVAKAYTETNGYFYVLGTNLAGGPYKVGVRGPGSATGMTATIGGGGCSTGGCHVGAAQGDVHNP